MFVLKTSMLTMISKQFNLLASIKLVTRIEERALSKAACYLIGNPWISGGHNLHSDGIWSTPLLFSTKWSNLKAFFIFTENPNAWIKISKLVTDFTNSRSYMIFCTVSWHMERFQQSEIRWLGLNLCSMTQFSKNTMKAWKHSTCPKYMTSSETIFLNLWWSSLIGLMFEKTIILNQDEIHRPCSLHLLPTKSLTLIQEKNFLNS